LKDDDSPADQYFRLRQSPSVSLPIVRLSELVEISLVASEFPDGDVSKLVSSIKVSSKREKPSFLTYGIWANTGGVRDRFIKVSG
jgi:hypothetical protein